MRLECASMFPSNLQQRLERLLAFRYTHLDVERFHGDPPDVVKHWNTASMFPGFYHRGRIPCTQKPLSRATLTLTHSVYTQKNPTPQWSDEQKAAHTALSQVRIFIADFRGQKR